MPATALEGVEPLSRESRVDRTQSFATGRFLVDQDWMRLRRNIQKIIGQWLPMMRSDRKPGAIDDARPYGYRMNPDVPGP